MADRRAVQKEQLDIFRKNLLRFSEKLNLFSRAGGEAELAELFEESLLTVPLLSGFAGKGPVLDMGSGNGFPGFVFGALYPETPVILCERNRKRAEFLKQILFQAKSANMKVLCRPAEELKTRFPLVLSKATGPTRQVLKVLEKVLRPDGRAFLWKSPGWEKDRPEGGGFSAEVFNSFSLNGKKRILLQVTRSPGNGPSSKGF